MAKENKFKQINHDETLYKQKVCGIFTVQQNKFSVIPKIMHLKTQSRI